MIKPSLFETLAQSLALECLYALGRHDDFRHAIKIFI